MKKKTIICVTDYVLPPFSIESKVLGNEFDIVHYSNLKKDELENIDCLMVWHKKVNKEFLKNFKKLKFVVRYGVGYDNIDLKILKKKKIDFSNNPDYGVEEVSDSTVAMILNFTRQINRYNFLSKSYRSGWQENTLPFIKRSSKTKVGIIGLGRIGSSVAKRLKSFNFDITFYDPFLESGVEKVFYLKRTFDLNYLLKVSDVITLHCPLTKKTKNIVNKSFLERMKPKSILINTARGGLIESSSLLYFYLKNNHLRSVGLDVLPDEPPNSKDLLIKDWLNCNKWLKGRLIINPHVAYYSKSSWNEMRVKAAETVKLFFKKGIHRNKILDKYE